MIRQFSRDVEDYFQELFLFNPIWATQFGDQRFHSLMPNYSRDRIQDFLRKNWEFTLKYQDQNFEDKEIDVDRQMMLSLTNRMILDLEGCKVMSRDPSFYIDDAVYGPYLLLIYDFAPLEERLLLVRERLKKVPSLLKYGKENLDDPPWLWLQIGIETLKASRELFNTVIPSLSTRFPSLEAEMSRLCRNVLECMQDFLNFLEGFPSPSERFAIGRELWEEYARKVHLLDYGPIEVFEFGRDLVSQTEKRIKEVTLEIDPKGQVQEVLSRIGRNHPNPEGLLDAYREAISRARSFIAEKNILSFPPGETLRVMETPEFDRILTPYASYLPPGPFFKDQPGIFWVTPIPSELSLREKEERLRSHSFSKIFLTSVHEAYPGHHLQIFWSNLSASLPRKIGHFVSSLFTEGWAFYCEELMEEVGFIQTLEEKMDRLSDQLFRAYRVLIDVGLHIGIMTVEEAVDTLVRKVGLEEGDARAEVLRYTASPTQPMTYAVGKMEILKLRDEYLRRGGGLRDFHDSLLKNGSLPQKLQGKLILG